jgi:hypothetical protein
VIGKHRSYSRFTSDSAHVETGKHLIRGRGFGALGLGAHFGSIAEIESAQIRPSPARDAAFGSQESGRRAAGTKAVEEGGQ